MANRLIESNCSFFPEEITEFVAIQFLSYSTLSPEKSIAALHRLGIALAHVNDEYPGDRLHKDTHRRVAVTGNILNASPQGVGIPRPDHLAAIVHANKYLSTELLARLRLG